MVKNEIFVIGGTMGVGKTAVCQKLKKKLDKAVFLDCDRCWDADPFYEKLDTIKIYTDEKSIEEIANEISKQ